MNNKTLQQRMLALALLAGASTTLAQDSIPEWTDSGTQSALGRYTIRHNNVTAVLRIEETQVSVTTLPDDTSAPNGHMVILSGRCDPGELDFRGIVNLTKSQKVTYPCPLQPDYTISFASVQLADYDDATTDPNGSVPVNEPLFTITDPEPEDLP